MYKRLNTSIENIFLEHRINRWEILWFCRAFHSYIFYLDVLLFTERNDNTKKGTQRCEWDKINTKPTFAVSSWQTKFQRQNAKLQRARLYRSRHPKHHKVGLRIAQNLALKQQNFQYSTKCFDFCCLSLQ